MHPLSLLTMHLFVLISNISFLTLSPLLDPALCELVDGLPMYDIKAVP